MRRLKVKPCMTSGIGPASKWQGGRPFVAANIALVPLPGLTFSSFKIEEYSSLKSNMF